MIGKTATSISITEIFHHFSEAEVLSSVLPEVENIPCLISSPLRVDNHPSFSFYYSKQGKLRFFDYAHPEERGGLIEFICKYWNCRFYEALDRLEQLMFQGKKVSSGVVKARKEKIKVLTQTLTSQIQVVVRPWRDYDIDYWKSFGIEKKWLKHAEVYPISFKIIDKVDTKGNTHSHVFVADKYAYCFVERKEGGLQLKIYQPFSTTAKWCSKMDGSVISLWTKIPEQGEKVVICSSLKDSLCLSCNMHIPAINPQGEGYTMSDTAVKELKRRYKKIYILFDNDKAGIEDAKRLAEKTGFINLTLPQFEGGKDVSDLYKSVGKEEFIKTINRLFEP